MSELNELALGALTGRGFAVPFSAFLVAGALVYVVARRLAHAADGLAAATGLGRVWIGAILLAASTSLPELITDVNAAALGAVDIGVGDLFGSTLANMLVLALLDIGYRQGRVLHRVAFEHALVGMVALVLTAIATLAIATGGLVPLGPIGLESLSIVLLYLFGMHAVYRGFGTAAVAAYPEPPFEGPVPPVRAEAVRFALGAVALMFLAPVLVVAAEAIALETGRSQSAVGTALVGAATSLPEIAATIAAARLGAFDLAVGNLLGSNAFNMCVLLAMDIAYTGGPVLAAAAPAHVLTGQVAVLVLALGVLAILARAQRRVSVLRLESLLIVTAYVSLIWALIE